MFSTTCMLTIAHCKGTSKPQVLPPMAGANAASKPLSYSFETDETI